MSCRTVSVAAAAAVAVATVAAIAWIRRNKRKRADVPDGHQKISLSDTEESWILILKPAVGTQTFYRGTFEEAEKHFRKRYRDILNANPWLAGRLVYDQGKPVIVFPETITDEIVATGEAEGTLLQINPPGLHINASMTIPEQGKYAAKATIPWGYAAIGDKDAPLVRLVVVQCRTADGSPADTSAGGAADFCVLLQTSHLAGDGHTHYKLLSMFSSEQTVQALNVKRCKGFKDKAVQLLNFDPGSWVSDGALLMNWLYNVVFGRRATYFTALVDHERVATLKAEAAAASESVAYLSTNDVLMSSLGNFAKLRSLLMAVNFRGRVAGVCDSDAGNYQGVMLFDQGVYKSPVGIRKALNTMNQKAAGGGDSAEVVCMTEPLPSVMNFRTDKFALATNWATFHKDVVVPGCEEILHVPVCDLDAVSYLFSYEVVIIFRVKPGQLAVLVLAKNFSEEEYLKALPLKKYVAPH